MRTAWKQLRRATVADSVAPVMVERMEGRVMMSGALGSVAVGGGGGGTSVGLLLPAVQAAREVRRVGIVDGTSNTIFFG